VPEARDRSLGDTAFENDETSELAHSGQDNMRIEQFQRLGGHSPSLSLYALHLPAFPQHFILQLHMPRQSLGISSIVCLTGVEG
jgi:hypothetical protein